MTDLSIVIVSWNAKEYLKECLTSLRVCSEELSMEIIVVENASTDGTPEMIRNQFPEVRLIENDANLGFARANNIGIKLASGKYISLINSDVNVPPDCLPKMRRYMEQQPTIGLLGPKMIGPDGHAHRSGMRFPSVWNVFLRALAVDSRLKGPRAIGGLLMGDFQFDQIKDIDVLNGWFWMTRREALAQVGLLDERFFIYGEDIDWCKRFHLGGWRVVFYPKAEALHYGGASSSNAPVRFGIEMQRSNLQYWGKYHGRTSMFFYVLAIWLDYIIRILGYGFVYLAKRSSRSRALAELKKNLAYMHWLLGLRTIEETKEQ
jgi:GT2 family glycosyltransferase